MGASLGFLDYGDLGADLGRRVHLAGSEAGRGRDHTSPVTDQVDTNRRNSHAIHEKGENTVDYEVCRAVQSPAGDRVRQCLTN